MNKFRKKWQNNSGMTLVEVLISVSILVFGIAGSLIYFTTATAAIQMARDQTTAVIHGEYILEDMSTKTALVDITSEDWADFVDSAGLNSLTDEAIAVAFTDPDTDPLETTVTVSWTSGRRARSIDLVTEFTE